MNKTSFPLLFIASVALTFSLSCDTLRKSGIGNVNIFPVSQDKTLGLQVKQEINGDKQQYKILARSQYKTAYSHLDRMMNTILNSGELKYKKEFAWETYIIHDDNTLNAFCTPGGYIYVYTGLIKYLDTESDLAGVLGHEIAHADRRHSTAQLTKLYGVEILSAMAVGSSGGALTDLAKNLVSLKFSRSHESDADYHSVKYLCPTSYNADGAAGFFQKLVNNKQTGGTPEFLSTHPSPNNRVKDIKSTKVEMNCKGSRSNASEYVKFKAALPK